MPPTSRPPRHASPALVFSCEHGGNRIPSVYRGLFAGHRAISALNSHRGWDPGALAVARGLARRLRATLEFHAYSRLLIDANRSPSNPRRFSTWTRSLDRAERERLQARFYEPYRRRVEETIGAYLEAYALVVHVSVHSFTPVLGAERRNADVGLLYDPSRRRERELARVLRASLVAGSSRFRVRRNYPYRGVDDGFVSFLRRRLEGERYIGLELELNQRLVAHAGAERRELEDKLVDALGQALSNEFSPASSLVSSRRPGKR